MILQIPENPEDWPEEMHIELQKLIQIVFKDMRQTVTMCQYHTDIDRREIKHLKEKMK